MAPIRWSQVRPVKQGTDPGGSGPVPIVDIAPFTTGETRGRPDIADAVRTACEEIGFFAITGHGFPEELVTRIYDVSHAFFDLPAEERTRSASPDRSWAA